MKKLSRLTSLVHALTKLAAAIYGLLKVIIKLVDMVGNYSSRDGFGEKTSVVAQI